VRLRLVFLVLLIAALGCSVPPALTPTPTGLPVTPAASGQPGSPSPPAATPRATTYVPGPTSPPAPLTHRIAIRYVYGLAEFYDRQSGEKFVPRGVNYFNLVQVLARYEDRSFGVGVYDRAQVQADFQRLRAAGYNTVRMFIDSCSSGPGCLAIEDGQGLNPAYLDNIVEVMALAKENDLVLLLTSNDLPDQGGYAELANQGSSEQFAGYRNAYYLTEQGLQAQRNYWGDLLSGLITRGAPLDAVLGWELLNEQWYFSDQPPFSLEEGTVTTANGQHYDMTDPQQKQAMAVEGMLYYIAELRQVILSHDPTALVTMGFFVPDYPNLTREGDFRYVETAGLLEAAALDFFDLHTYPTGELTLAEYAENFGLNERLSTPVIMGEVGAFTWAYPSVESAATTIQDWIAASCGFGFDGWLYWGYARAPEVLGDATWSFTDADGFLMDALSPHDQPDACTITVLPGRNLALGRPVTVSAGLPDQPPELAVDGTDAQWSAGAFPEQWLMIDLGAPQTIGSIRLLVGQWPAGRTVHQLFAAGPDGAMRLLVEFRGYTRDYDQLEFIPSAPLTNVQYIRVVTLESPSWVSWREIEVLAPFRPTPTPTATATQEATPTP
jgi:hypothetical protein